MQRNESIVLPLKFALQTSLAELGFSSTPETTEAVLKEIFHQQEEDTNFLKIFRGEVLLKKEHFLQPIEDPIPMHHYFPVPLRRLFDKARFINIPNKYLFCKSNAKEEQKIEEQMSRKKDSSFLNLESACVVSELGLLELCYLSVPSSSKIQNIQFNCERYIKTTVPNVESNGKIFANCLKARTNREDCNLQLELYITCGHYTDNTSNHDRDRLLILLISNWNEESATFEFHLIFQQFTYDSNGRGKKRKLDNLKHKQKSKNKKRKLSEVDEKNKKIRSSVPNAEKISNIFNTISQSISHSLQKESDSLNPSNIQSDPNPLLLHHFSNNPQSPQEASHNNDFNSNLPSDSESLLKIFLSDFSNDPQTPHNNDFNSDLPSNSDSLIPDSSQFNNEDLII